ncbi:hypothetical protein RF11_07799 [Thelohanellus kitauei]|uniref:Uncharacterized protein n=1 Tax=Thelohanellus kitauei TaxID=669202 RepID=A0A0C2NDP5_THEKT|nr:hypothetical protein RF11_07799 [Thelohanellus kitauei]
MGVTLFELNDERRARSVLANKDNNSTCFKFAVDRSIGSLLLPEIKCGRMRFVGSNSVLRFDFKDGEIDGETIIDGVIEFFSTTIVHTLIYDTKTFFGTTKCTSMNAGPITL